MSAAVESAEPRVVSFEIPRVPPSWSNRRQWWTERYSQMRAWKDEAWMRAQMARNEARLPTPRSLEAPRTVTITLHRRRLLDTDNAYTSIKPVLDGLQGVLIYNDSPRYCELQVKQSPVKTRDEERCFIEVSW